MKHLMQQEALTCWEWRRGGKLGQIFTFIFLAVVLFEGIKKPKRFIFHWAVNQGNKKGY